ncbi:MAG: adenylate/guanylate cyclase domain-containing protein [Gallionella sp.]|nr:adenylate/guanylate cyclase domain-containing protein [Gallionella sp.]
MEYSKKSVSGQISLKDRFNTYLSEAIHDVPVADRIILDTGDGAAVNFLGDVESALTAALRLRASLLNEDPYLEPQLLVRIGINLGPVRLVRDINGQPNIVGDGINVAQRVMGFADASQILVSRSYYDAVSRLSAQYTGMFHYQGSRTDKHVREHEIYAIGYPGDQTTRGMRAAENTVLPRNVGMLHHAVVLWNTVSVWLDNALERLVKQVRQADARQRILYSGVVVVPLLLLFAALVLIPTPQVAEIEWADKAETPPVETMQDVLPPPILAENATSDRQVTDRARPDKTRPDKTRTDKTSRQAVAQAKQEVYEVAKKQPAPVKSSESQVQHKSSVSTGHQSVTDTSSPESSEDASILVICREGTRVFIDGAAKGVVTSGSLTVTAKPGKHKLIVNHASFGVYSEDVDVGPGKTIRIKPKVCN